MTIIHNEDDEVSLCEGCGCLFDICELDEEFLCDNCAKEYNAEDELLSQEEIDNDTD